MSKALNSDHPLLSDCLESKSACEFLVRDFREALVDAQHAFHSRRKNFRANCSVLSEADALQFSDWMRRSADRGLTCYFENGQRDSASTNLACEIVLSAKGVVSDEILDRRGAMEAMSDPAILRISSAYRQVRRRLSDTFVQDLRTIKPLDTPQTLVSLGRTSDSLEAELALRSASFRKLREQSDVTAAGVGGRIPAQAALIEYMKYYRVDFKSNRSTSHYLAVVLRSLSPPVLVDLDSAATIDSVVGLYQAHFRSASKKWPTLSDRELRETDEVLRDLYQRIIGPLEVFVKDSHLLMIAPDGSLNFVSFGTLKNGVGRYLIQDRRIHYLNAARELLRLQDRNGAGEGLLALGDPDFNATSSERAQSSHTLTFDTAPSQYSRSSNGPRSSLDSLRDLNFSPLPYTRREVLEVSSFWKSQSRGPAEVLLGAAASEERFKRQSPGKRVIHIATHAFFRLVNHGDTNENTLESATLSRNPLLYSGLLLAGANACETSAGGFKQEDGFLTADEIAAMRLDGTRLVVLSACETGLGEIETGEGVFGLRRAFQIAGVRTIVSSLWQVPDRETEMIMETLYSTRRETLDVAMQQMSLRQIEQNRERRLPDHPYLWGAFIAVGDWRDSQ